MSFAVASDVAGRLGRALTAAETSLVTLVLGDVENIILVRIPDLVAQVNAVPPTIALSMVVQAEAWAVVRFIKNPDGKSAEELQGEYSFTRDKAVASGILYLTDDEWDNLSPSSGTSSAFSILPYNPTTCAAPTFPNDWFGYGFYGDAV